MLLKSLVSIDEWDAKSVDLLHGCWRTHPYGKTGQSYPFNYNYYSSRLAYHTFLFSAFVFKS